MKNVRLYAVAGLLVLSSQGQAERYSTWLDESGQVHLERVKEAENPLLKRAEEVAQQASGSAKQTAEKTTGPESAQLPNEQMRALAESEAFVEADSVGKTEPKLSQDEPSAAAPKPVVETADQATNSADGSSSNPTAAPASNQSATDSFNPDDYIDAEEFARRGYVRESEEGRFYTWVDVNGVIYNSPYPPPQDEASNQADQAPTRDELDFSPAMRVERRLPLVAPSESQADPVARQLLKLDDPAASMVGRFAQDCCVKLPNHAVGKLHPEDGYLVEFDSRLEGYPFATGESVYQLVRLPDVELDYVLQLRTFLNGSLFYPTLVFLNEALEPQRLVSHVVHEFEPENWFRHGYLEGRVPVESSQGERYVLVITTADDLKLTSRVPGKKREKDVIHSQQGLVHLAVLETR